jgi:hypothetical protein
VWPLKAGLTESNRRRFTAGAAGSAILTYGTRNPLRPCGYGPMTERLGNVNGCSQYQMAKPSAADAGGSWWKERPRQSQRRKGSCSQSTSGGGWPEKTCGRVPNLRHRLRGRWEEFGERRRAECRRAESDAGRERGQAGRGQASLERDVLTMEPETGVRSRQGASWK